VLWARLNTADEKDWHRGSATITSKHLLKVLEKEPRRIDASRYATVVGTVTCADHGEGNYSSVMIPTVLHIHGDAGWRKAVFEMRQWLARLVGEIV
jgi:ribosomal protein L35AE/L33A